jgi:hypothetical protein
MATGVEVGGLEGRGRLEAVGTTVINSGVNSVSRLEGRVGLEAVGAGDDATVAVTAGAVSGCEAQETNNAPARASISDV